jgi:RHS repeat-associated protein
MCKVVDVTELQLCGQLPGPGISSPAAQSPVRTRTSTTRSELPSAFHYYGYRQLNPLTGRWVSRDPIEEEGGVNLYGFVGNDGVGRWDVLGMAEGNAALQSICDCIISSMNVSRIFRNIWGTTWSEAITVPPGGQLPQDKGLHLNEFSSIYYTARWNMNRKGCCDYIEKWKSSKNQYASPIKFSYELFVQDKWESASSAINTQGGWVPILWGYDGRLGPSSSTTTSQARTSQIVYTPPRARKMRVKLEAGDHVCDKTEYEISGTAPVPIRKRGWLNLRIPTEFCKAQPKNTYGTTNNTNNCAGYSASP